MLPCSSFFFFLVGMAEVITWIRFGGKFEASSTYVGGDTEILLLNNDVDYNGLKQMVAE